MMRSMFAGVSGLQSHQVKMDVIGNNIANVNTTGYKASRVTFQEALSQTLKNAFQPTDGRRGGINPQQVGLGTRLGSIDISQTQGGAENTGVATDLAIEGTGFFIVSSGDDTFYTRAGNFDFDEQGSLVSTSNGMRVMGYLADEEGNIRADGAALSPLSVPMGTRIPPEATSTVTFGGNLSADIPAHPHVVTGGVALSFPGPLPASQFTVQVDGNPQQVQIPQDNYTRTSFLETVNGQLTGVTASVNASGNLVLTHDVPGTAGSLSVDQTQDWAQFFQGFTSETGRFDTVTRMAVIHDSLGATHQVNTTFTKLEANEWVWSSELVEHPGIQVGQGSISFHTDGSVVQPAVEAMTIPSNLLSPGQANDITVELDFSDVTQYAESTTAAARRQDGYPSGSLDSIAIDERGIIIGSFSNGLSRNLGQVPLAWFSNPAALMRVGGTLFTHSANSGQAVVSLAGTEGLGSINSDSLEMSNVDLSKEFTDMIITQRGFQANSRIISSCDEMLQELVNLKR